MDAARRENSRLSDIWHSSFIKSFSVLVQSERQLSPNYIIEMLNSTYIDRSEGKGRNDIGQRTIDMAFSCLFEAILQEQRSVPAGPGRIDMISAEHLDQNFLGPRGASLSVASSTAIKCLCRWSRRRIFTGQWIDTAQTDSFVSSLIRWIWAVNIPTPNDIRMLTSYVSTLGPRCSDQVISLLHLENDLARRLDLTFSALSGLKPDPDPERYQFNLISLAVALINLIAIHTTLSREQAGQLLSIYNLIGTLDSWIYSWRGDGEKQAALESIRQLWENLYGSYLLSLSHCISITNLFISFIGPGCIDSDRNLLLPDSFADQA